MLPSNQNATACCNIILYWIVPSLYCTCIYEDKGANIAQSVLWRTKESSTRIRIQAGERDFSPLHSVQTCSAAHPPFIQWVPGAVYLGTKRRELEATFYFINGDIIFNVLMAANITVIWLGVSWYWSFSKNCSSVIQVNKSSFPWLQGVTSQKLVLLILTAVRTSNLILLTQKYTNSTGRNFVISFARWTVKKTIKQERKGLLKTSLTLILNVLNVIK
jgi:hypothetical protein